jgi:hypothetical protein
MKTSRALRFGWVAAVLLVSSGLAGAGGPPRKPARVDVAVAPASLAAGATATVTVKVVPAEGVKINRYPKIQLKVPEVASVVAAAEASIGNAAPPPADDMTSNYFKEPEPLRLDLQLSPVASRGSHEVRGELKYFYCVAASGFCAPAKTEIKIPLKVR